MLRKKLRGKIIKKQLFLEELINLYKNNSTSESHRFNSIKNCKLPQFTYGTLKCTE
jgi:hypothetical protein